VWILSDPIFRCKPERWPEALIVRIDAHNLWYLSGKLTSASALPNDLKTELSRRAQWVVYFEADPEIPYASAVGGMEIIRAAHAGVILLTPASEKREKQAGLSLVSRPAQLFDGESRRRIPD